MSLPADSASLLSKVPADGAAIGNQNLRETLGWDDERYLAARQPLLDQGLLVTGRGRGGSVMLAPEGSTTASPAPNAPGEMFAAEVFSGSAPGKPQPAPPKAKPKPGTPVTNYQFPSANRKNIPPAGLATRSAAQDHNPHLLAYDPHLTPVLRFDSSGATDHLTAKIQAVLERAKTRPLTPEETQILSEAFAAFSGTKSLPFHPGEHKRVALKVIDPRGNEVMRVHNLEVDHG